MALQLSFLPNVQFGGSFVADNLGYYQAKGLSVTLLPGGPNIAAEPIVAAGKALVGITHTSELAQAIANGARLTVVGAGYQKNPFCLVSRAEAPISEPAAMVGKKIGVATANVPVFRAFLKANGIDPAKVTMVTIQFDPTPLATREVDALIGFYTNEPIQLSISGVPVHTLLLNDYGYPMLEELYVVRTADLEDQRRRALVAAFLDAERQGWQKCLDDPQLAATLAVQKYGADQKLDQNQQLQEAVKQKDLVVDADTKAHGLFWMSPEKVEATRRSLQLGGVALATNVFTTDLLTAG